MKKTENPHIYLVPNKCDGWKGKVFQLTVGPLPNVEIEFDHARLVSYERGVIDFQYIDEIDLIIDIQIISKCRSVSDMIHNAFKDMDTLLLQMCKQMSNKLKYDIKHSLNIDHNMYTALQEAYNTIPGFITRSIKYMRFVDRFGIEEDIKPLELDCYDLVASWIVFANFCFQTNSVDSHRNLSCAFNSLEYCVDLTIGDQILKPSEDQFLKIFNAVGECMNNLIGHIELHGAHSLKESSVSESNKPYDRKYLVVMDKTSPQHESDAADDTIVCPQLQQRRIQIIEALDQQISGKNQKAGKVIGSEETFDQMITELSLTSKNIPLRWSVNLKCFLVCSFLDWKIHRWRCNWFCLCWIKFGIWWCNGCEANHISESQSIARFKEIDYR